MSWAVAAVKVLHVVGLVHVLLHLGQGRGVDRGRKQRDSYRFGYVEGRFLRRAVHDHLRLGQSVSIGGERHAGWTHFVSSVYALKHIPLSCFCLILQQGGMEVRRGKDYSRGVPQGSKIVSTSLRRCVTRLQSNHVCFVTSPPPLSADRRSQLIQGGRLSFFNSWSMALKVKIL